LLCQEDTLAVPDAFKTRGQVGSRRRSHSKGSTIGKSQHFRTEIELFRIHFPKLEAADGIRWDHEGGIYCRTRVREHARRCVGVKPSLIARPATDRLHHLCPAVSLREDLYLKNPNLQYACLQTMLTNFQTFDIKPLSFVPGSAPGSHN
jgi:hypothetical protein